MTNPGIMILVMFMFAIQLAVVLIGLWFVVKCYSSGTVYKNTTIGYPLKTYSLEWYSYIALVFIFIVWIWVFLFINNLGDYMVSAIICEDYFKVKGGFRGFCGAICNTFVFHLGSVALASVILLPCTIIQFLFGWIYDLGTKTGDEVTVQKKDQTAATGTAGQPKKADDGKGGANAAQRCLSKVCCCLFWPYKKLVMRIGEQGFPMGYLACANFVPSSKEGYYLLLTYSNILGDVALVNFLYRLTGTLAIAFLNTTIAWLFFKYLPYYAEKLESPLMPSFVPYI